MADPRASTVYDYAALRVHPDGSRVRAPQRTSVNTWDNSDTPSSSAFAAPPMRTAASVVQDARAQWIARDAGGSARIPLTMGRRRRSARTVREGEREVEEDIARGMAAADEALRFDDEDEDDDEFNPREGISADSAQEGQGKTQKRGVKRKRTADTRPAKRARFAADMAYLASPPAPPAATQFANAHPGADDVTQTYANPQATAGETSQLSGPSPDLLKALHRFASEFYAERGQLLNISREYRRERKRRKEEMELEKEKEKAAGTPPADGAEAGDASGAEGAEDKDEDEDEDEGEVVEEEEEEKEEEEESDANADEEEGEGEDGDGTKHKPKRKLTRKAKGKGKAKAKTKRKVGKPLILPPVYTDMYKVFEGSALMVLGMLVQEHIVSLLTPHKPPGWDEDVRVAYAERADEDANEEEEEEEEADEGEGEGNDEREGNDEGEDDNEGEDEQDDDDEAEEGGEDISEKQKDMQEDASKLKKGPKTEQESEEEDEDSEDDDEVARTLLNEKDQTEESEENDEDESDESTDDEAAKPKVAPLKVEKTHQGRVSTESSSGGEDEDDTDEEEDEKPPPSAQPGPSSSNAQKNQGAAVDSSSGSSDRSEGDEEDTEDEDEDEDEPAADPRPVTASITPSNILLPKQCPQVNNKMQGAVTQAPAPMDVDSDSPEDEEDEAMGSDDTVHSDSEEEYI